MVKDFTSWERSELTRQNDLISAQLTQMERHHEERKQQGYQDRIYQLRLALAQSSDLFQREQIQELLDEATEDYYSYLEQLDKQRKFALLCGVVVLLVGFVIFWSIMQNTKGFKETGRGDIRQEITSAGRSSKEKHSPAMVQSSSSSAVSSDSSVVTHPIPDVVGYTIEEAIQQLEKSTFFIGTIQEEYSDTVAEGIVMATKPSAYINSKQGSKIDLVLSKGSQPLVIPDVIGRDRQIAEKELLQTGFTVETIGKHSDTIAKGKVIFTEEGTGTSLAKGSTVHLVISLGPTLKMPKLGYLEVSYAEAVAKLKEIGVAENRIQRVEDRSVLSDPGDMVVHQSVRAGETISDEITLYVSKQSDKR